MTNQITNQLKEFYKSFYNGNFYRDVRYIYPPRTVAEKVKQPYADRIRFNLNNSLNHTKDFYKFIFSKGNDPKKPKKVTGNLYAEITHFKSNAELNGRNDLDRFTDRLYYDFDTEDPRVKIAKDNIKNALRNYTGTERINELAIARKEFKDLIINTDVLKKPYEDAQKFIKVMQDNGVTCYLRFSGSKGFSINIFLPVAIKLDNANKIIETLLIYYKNKLELETLDLNVKDHNTRLQRMPYTLHYDTLLYNTDIPLNATLDEILAKVKANKRTPHAFDIETYNNNEYLKDLLIKYDNKITIEIAKNKELTEELKQLQQTNIKNGVLNYSAVTGNNSIFDDMRVLCKLIIGEPVKEYTNYNVYNCIFHDDQNPSARVYANNYYCSGCNTYYRYGDFLKAYYNLETDDELIKKMKEIKAKVKEKKVSKKKKKE